MNGQPPAPHGPGALAPHGAPAPPAQQQVRLPQQGAFAISEVLPIMQHHAAELRRLRDERKRLRDAAAQAKANARRVRANLVAYLRTFGNDVTGAPIKTSAERQEWADADAEVQQAELDADLAQAAAINAGDALADQQAIFATLQTMLGVERDVLKAERHGG